MRNRLCLWAVLVATFLCGGPLFAQGMLRSRGGDTEQLRLKSVAGKVDIKGSFAKTELTSVYQNEAGRQTEADFSYTVPPGAVVTYFAYWFQGKKVVARVVEKERALSIYETIKEVNRDPALIEQTGTNTFRARIFPVEENADLKIEMRWVQALASDDKGLLYTFPLKGGEETPGTLESVDVNFAVTQDAGSGRLVNSLNLPVEDKGGRKLFNLSQKNYSPKDDVKVRIERPKRALSASMFSAPSGGKDGFFVIALTPGQSVSRPRLQIQGVRTFDVVPSKLPALKAGKTFVVAGRYKGSGTAKLILHGYERGTATQSVVFSNVREDNSLATKFWGAKQIESLSPGLKVAAKNRERVIELSTRYTLPSMVTSWLAVPASEWKRFEIQIAENDIWRIGPQLITLQRRGQSRTRTARRLRTQFNAACKVLGNNPVQELASIREQHYQDTFYERDQAASSLVYAILDKDHKEAARLRRQIAAFNRQMGSPRDAGISRQYRKIGIELAQSVAGAKYEDSGDVTEKDRMEENRRSVEILFPNKKKRAQIFWEGEKAWAQNIDSLAAYVALNRLNQNPNETQIKHHENRLRIAARIHARQTGSASDERTETIFRRELAQAEVNAIGWQAGILHNKIKVSKSLGNSSKERLAFYESELKKLTAKASPEGRKRLMNPERGRGMDNFESVRQMVLDEASAENPDEAHYAQLKKELLRRVEKSSAVGKDRAERINIRADKDKIDRHMYRHHASLSEEELNKLREEREKLQTKENELAVRMGDPRIQVLAPEDAQQVVAVFPDGTVKPLRWNKDTQRWEIRFDVPTYAEEGRYAVRIVMTLADGTRRNLSFHFNVDVTAPNGKGFAQSVEKHDGTRVWRLEFEGDDDTARVHALMPWGEMVKLAPSNSGASDDKKSRYFALAEVPSQWGQAAPAVTFIITDRAHNRTEVQVDLQP